MKKIILGVLMIASTSLVGCGGGFKNDMTKLGAIYSTGDWRVTVWSGGQPVKVYEVHKGFISTESGSDGWYFNYNGKLVRVAGTVTIEEL